MHPYILPAAGIAIVGLTAAVGGLAFLALCVALRASKRADRALGHQAKLMDGLTEERESALAVQEAGQAALAECVATVCELAGTVRRLEGRGRSAADGPWSLVD